MRTRGCSFSYWEKQNTESQLDLPDSRRDSIMLLCHIIPLPSPFIVPSSASTQSNAVPGVYPSYLILCRLLICILATITATAHCWHLWGKNNGSGWRTISSTKTPSGEPLTRHRFRCPSRCAYSREICQHFTSLFWNNTKKWRWTDLLFLLIPMLLCPPTHQSQNTDRFLRWTGRWATLTGDNWCKCK